MVIDDIADRPHDCDILLDQNLYQAMETRYDNLVPTACKKLIGPRYALLRSEFAVARENLRQRDGHVKRIVVFFGGVDPTNETAKALEAVRMLDRPNIAVDVVVGGANPNKRAIKSLCLKIPNVSFHCQVNNMAELMAAADLANWCRRCNNMGAMFPWHSIPCNVGGSKPAGINRNWRTKRNIFLSWSHHFCFIK